MKPYYEQDGITIYHGDCREVLPSVDAQVVVPDPPYGVGLTSFDDDFEVTPLGLDLATGDRAAVFMSPRRVFELARRLTTWNMERLLWMHKTADMAAPWRGWCMNGEAIMVMSRPGAVWPPPVNFRADTYTVGPWERAGHPNGKPLTVVRDLVARLSTATETILDPFVGSGTTLRAAKDLGRSAIGIEIEERYCEIAVRRLAQGVLAFE